MARIALYYWSQDMTRRDGSRWNQDLYNITLDAEVDMVSPSEFERRTRPCPPKWKVPPGFTAEDPWR